MDPEVQPEPIEETMIDDPVEIEQPTQAPMDQDVGSTSPTEPLPKVKPSSPPKTKPASQKPTHRRTSRTSTKPPPSKKEKRVKVTTTGPIITESHYGVNVDLLHGLQELARVARDAAANRTIQIEEENPNKP